MGKTSYSICNFVTAHAAETTAAAPPIIPLDKALEQSIGKRHTHIATHQIRTLSVIVSKYKDTST